MPISKETIRQHLRNYPVDLLLPIAIGFICGLEVVFIRTTIPLAFKGVMAVVNLGDYLAIPVIFASLLIGAYLTGRLSERMREASGVGLDVAIESYHSRAGMMSAKLIPLKYLATLFTLGSGGSGGLVGPTAAIGQGTASCFSRWFKLPEDKSRIMALCGIAACVSGLLNAPFGAAVFALELCYLGGILYEDLIPVLLSSISAYIMSERIVQKLPFGDLLHGPHLFRSIISDTAFQWSLDYLAYCVITALFTTLLAILFIKSFQAFENFSKTEINSKYGAIFGAALVATLAILFFRHRMTDVLGHPGDLVARCATEGYLLDISIALLIGRWITTFITVGLGGSGGLFSPTVLMGGLAGTIVAGVLGVASTKVLVTTGISAALVGVMNVPMAAVIIVIELFGISFIIPAAIGSAIASMLAKNFVIYSHVEKHQEFEKQ
jgi:CIC family chloride channel protein